MNRKWMIQLENNGRNEMKTPEKGGKRGRGGQRKERTGRGKTEGSRRQGEREGSQCREERTCKEKL